MYSGSEKTLIEITLVIIDITGCGYGKENWNQLIKLKTIWIHACKKGICWIENKTYGAVVAEGV